MKLKDASIGAPVIVHHNFRRANECFSTTYEGQVGHISGFALNSMHEVILKIKGIEEPFIIHPSNVELLNADSAHYTEDPETKHMVLTTTS